MTFSHTKTLGLGLLAVASVIAVGVLYATVENRNPARPRRTRKPPSEENA